LSGSHEALPDRLKGVTFGPTGHRQGSRRWRRGESRAAPNHRCPGARRGGRRNAHRTPVHGSKSGWAPSARPQQGL